MSRAADSSAKGLEVTDKPLVQMAILLDTSGSMSGLIDQARAEVWAIVNETQIQAQIQQLNAQRKAYLAQAQKRPYAEKTLGSAIILAIREQAQQKAFDFPTDQPEKQASGGRHKAASHTRKPSRHGCTRRTAVPLFLSSALNLLAMAGLVGLRLFQVRRRKIIAQEKMVVINNQIKIPHESIQQINKTHFDKKGVFVVSYEDEDGKSRTQQFDDRKYDNMKAILDHLVEQIS